jgi:hypothetical protein
MALPKAERGSARCVISQVRISSIEHRQPLLGARPPGLHLGRVELPDPLEDLTCLRIEGLRFEELPPYVGPAVREPEARARWLAGQHVVRLVAIADHHALVVAEHLAGRVRRARRQEPIAHGIFASDRPHPPALGGAFLHQPPPGLVHRDHARDELVGAECRLDLLPAAAAVLLALVAYDAERALDDIDLVRLLELPLHGLKVAPAGGADLIRLVQLVGDFHDGQRPLLMAAVAGTGHPAPRSSRAPLSIRGRSLETDRSA